MARGLAAARVPPGVRSNKPLSCGTEAATRYRGVFTSSTSKPKSTSVFSPLHLLLLLLLALLGHAPARTDAFDVCAIAVATPTVGPDRYQGLTLVHLSAQRERILWDSFGALFSPTLLDSGTRGVVAKTAQVELNSGRVYKAPVAVPPRLMACQILPDTSSARIVTLAS